MQSRHFPEAIVRFVAKTGFISKDIWQEFYFSGGGIRWRQQAWVDLARRGYLAPHSFERIDDVYVLNRRNREVMGFVCGRAAKPPAVAQIIHDEILNQGLLRLERGGCLGDWSTEAELKSESGKGVYRIESQGQAIKYPDALIHSVGLDNSDPVAIELEKTLKSRTRYQQILTAYAAMRNLGALLYVCDSLAIEKAIRETLATVYFPESEVPVGVARIESWRSDPLQMEVSVGRQRMRCTEFLGLRRERALRRPRAS